MGRIKTYIRGLDERVEGGIPEGYVSLICGSSGSMKSSLAFNIIYGAAKEDGKKGLYITLEQSKNSIVRHVRKLGIDLSEVSDKLTIMDLGRLRKELGEEVLAAGFDERKKQSWMMSLQHQINRYKEMLGFDILVIDSLDALYALSVMKKPRKDLFHFFEGLRDIGVTTFLVSEMPQSGKEFGKYGVESFLCDGIIHLTMERTGRTVGRFINIVKMRETKHATDYFPLLVNARGFGIVTR